LRKFFALAFVLFGVCASLAQTPSFMTPAQLYSYILTQLPTNGNGLINAQQLRSVLDNMVASTIPAGGTSPIVSVAAYNASGSATVTNGSMTNGSNVLAIVGPNDFANGQGIIVYGAGMPTAAPPTNLAVVPQGTPGTTTYSYQIASVQNGGFGPAISAVSTATGAATLSNTNYNAITWNTGAGAQSYAVWRSTNNGTYTLLGVFAGYVNGTSASLNDTGFTPNTEAWNWAPSAPTTSAVPGFLLSTVISGSGTSNLVLSNNALVTVSGGVVLHDDTAAITSALNAFPNGNVTLQFGCNTTYNISSPLTFSTPSIGLSGCGQGSTVIQVNPHAQVRAMIFSAGLSTTISHLSLNGNNLNGGQLSQDLYTGGIYLLHAGPIIDDVEIYNTSFQGIFADGSTVNNAIVQNSNIHNVGDPGDVWGSGIKIYGGATNVKILHNSVFNNGGLTVPGSSSSNNGGGALCIDSYYSSVIGNYFHDNYNFGGQLADCQGVAAYGTQHWWNISDNVFEIDNEPSTSSTSGIELNGYYANIANNVFNGGSRGSAIFFDFGSGNTIFGATNIIGNIITGLGTGVTIANDSSPATGYVENVNIIGNQFAAITTDALFVSSRAERIVFALNNYSNSGGAINVNGGTGVTLSLNIPNTADTGVTCATGSPTSSFSASGGIVTHC
jgi:hypothetical protein